MIFESGSDLDPEPWGPCAAGLIAVLAVMAWGVVILAAIGVMTIAHWIFG